MSAPGRKQCPQCNTECLQTEMVCWACGALFPRENKNARGPLVEPSNVECSFHPESPAVARCSACNRHLCDRCAIPILQRIYCQKCVYLFADLPTVFKQLHQSANEMARLAAEKERITSELRIAHDMQMSMMPRGSPDISGLEITGMCHPAGNVGGDYYDYFPLPDGRLGVVVGDVTGKGVPAALLMAMTKSFLIAQMASDCDPTAVLRNLSVMVASLEDRRRLMTFFYAVIDPVKRRITYANAGHNYPYLLVPEDGRPRFLEAEGVPLGAALSSDYKTEQCELPDRGMLILYSDGLVEAKNASGNLYGYPRFERVLFENRGLTAAQMRTRVAQDVVSFLRSRPPDDDITLVVIRKV